MRDGLYKAAFSGPMGDGSGVVVLRDNKILGGDENYYYVGNFMINGTDLTSTFNVDKHTSGGSNVFGKDKATVIVHGSDKDTSCRLETPLGSPKFVVELTLLIESSV